MRTSTELNPHLPVSTRDLIPLLILSSSSSCTRLATASFKVGTWTYRLSDRRTDYRPARALNSKVDFICGWLISFSPPILIPVDPEQLLTSLPCPCPASLLTSMTKERVSEELVPRVHATDLPGLPRDAEHVGRVSNRSTQSHSFYLLPNHVIPAGVISLSGGF